MKQGQQKEQTKGDETIEFLNKIGFRIDQSTLNECDSDTISELYASLMELNGIIERKELEVEYNAMHFFQYPNIHQSSIFKFKLFHKMQAFLSKHSNIKDFASSDIFTPNSKKTRKVLNLLISFNKHKLHIESQLKKSKDQIIGAQATLEQTKERLAKTQEDHEKATKMIEAKKAEGEAINEQIKAVQKENAECANNLNQKQEEKEQLIGFLKEINEKLECNKQLNITYMNKQKALKGQIVSSPEKMTAILFETQNQIDGMNKEINEKEAEIIKTERYWENLDQFQISMKEIKNCIDKIEKTKMENDEKDKQLLLKQEAIEKKMSSIKVIEENIHFIHESIEKFKKYYQENDQKRNVEDTMLKKQLDELKESEVNAKDKKDSLIKEIEGIEKNIENYLLNLETMDNITEEYGNTMLKKMETIREGVNQYVLEVNKMLANAQSYHSQGQLN